jgi:hypothetical protein
LLHLATLSLLPFHETAVKHLPSTPATLALPLRDPPGHGWIAVVRYKDSNKLTVGMCMEMR